MNNVNALIDLARMCEQLPELVRTCAEALERGITDGDDFETFDMRYPSPDELSRWCVETANWIASEPVHVENDRDAILALSAIYCCLRCFPEPLRHRFVRDVWRAYAEAANNTAALEVLF